MPGADVAELKVFGRRSMAIDRLVQRITARVQGVAEVSSAVSARDRRRARTGARREVLAPSTTLRPADLARVAVVNALPSSGRTTPGTVTKLVRTARAEQPDRSIVVVLDEGNAEVVRAALDAGADEFLGREELENEEAVIWRLRNALHRARAAPAVEEPTASPPRGARPLKIGPGTRLTDAEVRRADAAIDDAVAKLPTAEERRAFGTGLLEIVAPELRDPESGRLDAKRIAEATGLSLTTLARASGVTQQALSATPDSPTAQAGLLPVARLSGLLDELLPPEHKRAWLQTPRPRFGDRSPKQAIEEGDAELVSLIVEAALDGNLD